MTTIIKLLVQVAMLILWGFCICIGFWIGHKLTELVDRKAIAWRENKDGLAAMAKVEAEMKNGTREPVLT